jgi:hypothetical protein
MRGCPGLAPAQKHVIAVLPRFPYVIVDDVEVSLASGATAEADHGACGVGRSGR